MSAAQWEDTCQDCGGDISYLYSQWWHNETTRDHEARPEGWGMPGAQAQRPRNVTASVHKERLRSLFDTTPGALKFAPEGELFTLKAGDKSKWYIDCRVITFADPMLVGSVFSHEFLDDPRIERAHLGRITQQSIVFGPAFGAVPIAVSMASALGCRCGTIRPEPKDHGASGQSLIVGPTKPGDHVILVEDVWTTGSTLETAFGAVAHHYESAHWEWELDATLVLVNRAKRGTLGFEAQEFRNAPLINIFRPDDLGAPVE